MGTGAGKAVLAGRRTGGKRNSQPHRASISLSDVSLENSGIADRILEERRRKGDDQVAKVLSTSASTHLSSPVPEVPRVTPEDSGMLGWSCAGGDGHGRSWWRRWKFRLNMRKNFFPLRVTEPWPRLPREAVESPSLDIFQTRLDMVLCSLL